MRRAHCVFVERTHSIENTLYIEHVLTCEFARYLEKMRRGRTWGDELTLRGICNSFGCHIHVVTSTEKNWYLEYEPDTVLTDKQVFLCFVECVPLLVCRMCSHATLYAPASRYDTHVSSSSYDTHVISCYTLRTDKQVFLCFTSLSHHHITSPSLT
jgi:hypothetical protein